MELAQMLFYTMGTIAVSVYLIDKIKERIQDYHFRRHAQRQIDKFEEMTGINYLEYQERKFNKVIEEAIKSSEKEMEDERWRFRGTEILLRSFGKRE